MKALRYLYSIAILALMCYGQSMLAMQSKIKQIDAMTGEELVDALIRTPDILLGISPYSNNPREIFEQREQIRNRYCALQNKLEEYRNSMPTSESLAERIDMAKARLERAYGTVKVAIRRTLPLKRPADLAPCPVPVPGISARIGTRPGG